MEATNHTLGTNIYVLNTDPVVSPIFANPPAANQLSVGDLNSQLVTSLQLGIRIPY